MRDVSSSIHRTRSYKKYVAFTSMYWHAGREHSSQTIQFPLFWWYCTAGRGETRFACHLMLLISYGAGLSCVGGEKSLFRSNSWHLQWWWNNLQQGKPATELFLISLDIPGRGDITHKLASKTTCVSHHLQYILRDGKFICPPFYPPSRHSREEKAIRLSQDGWGSY